MMLDSNQSIEFVNVLEENGFNLNDWEFLETLLQAEGLSDEQMEDLEVLRKTLKEVSKKYSV